MRTVTRPGRIRSARCRFLKPHQLGKRRAQLSSHNSQTKRYVRSSESRIGGLIAQLAQHRPKIRDGRCFQNAELAFAIKRALTQ
jgi:hypothetical protein